jgi:branched-chain amino acid transport system permease protein
MSIGINVLLKLLPELFRGIVVFGKSLQEYRTIIYCVLIILVINYRQKGLLGEEELDCKKLHRSFVIFLPGTGRSVRPGGSGR